MLRGLYLEALMARNLCIPMSDSPKFKQKLQDAPDRASACKLFGARVVEGPESSMRGAKSGRSSKPETKCVRFASRASPAALILSQK